MNLQRKKIYDDLTSSISLDWACEPGVSKKKLRTVTFKFSIKGLGFGDIHFYQDANGQLYVDSENLGRINSEKILHLMLETAIFDTDAEPGNHRKYLETLKINICECSGCQRRPVLCSK